jgi:signal recognition particle subunit SRP54
LTSDLPRGTIQSCAFVADRTGAAMFDTLTQKLQATFRTLRGRGRLTEANIRDALREVRLALLEADVNYRVVRDFIRRVEEKAIGQSVLQSLTPEMQVVTIVRDELASLMGEKAEGLRPAADGVQALLLVGLNGTGKTTACAKLARRLQREGRSPLLVACDVYRPAAIRQLQVLGDQIGAPVFAVSEKTPPARIAAAARRHARAHGHNAIIFDTAGRLQTNDELMQELEDIRAAVEPTDILLVADATTGQEAVGVAEEFHRRLQLTGVVLTKMDGDARGGAAISIRAVTGCPIKFVGVGEKTDALEEFHPERIASRILGQGDLLSLMERADAAIDEEQARTLEAKILRREELTFSDLLVQLRAARKMGGLDQLLEMVPGLSRFARSDLAPQEAQLQRDEAMILSMTAQERQNHRLLDGSRKRRIARGSGTTVQEVNQLIQKLAQAQSLMRHLSGAASGAPKGKRRRAMEQAFRLPARF